MGNKENREMRRPGPPELGPKEDRNFVQFTGVLVTLCVALSTRHIEPAIATLVVASLGNSFNEFRVLRKESKENTRIE